MKWKKAVWLRAPACALALALVVGWGGEARATFYAYSVEQTSGYTFTGATVGTISPLSASSSAQVGSPSGNDAHTGGLDVLQSYVGPAAGNPGENVFTPKGMTTPDYSRGDALITVTPGFTTNNVAESFLTGPGSSNGSGSWAVSAPITLTSSGTVTLGFSFTNRLTLNISAGSPPGVVAADYN